MSSRIDGDKTRRKRLKVVSACCECRRKKTKCNGETPCTGCIKAHVECKYNCPQKPTTSPEPIKKYTKPIKTPTHRLHQSIQSIEERLGAIENILRTLLGSGKNKYLLQGLHQKPETPCLSDPDSDRRKMLKRPREEEGRDDFGYFERPKFQLAPIYHEQKLRPGNIQSLLNEDDMDLPYRFYSTPTHSAFKRMVVHLPNNNTQETIM
ncbi:hypothetical protein BDB01DRAFT_805840 [Pilobolus umbonatus]|nr:hypothetical protein BDB01DRAFT_805840 [Pilobolus umbonatus]